MYSQDIGMEFGIEKCTMLIMKSGKRHMVKGIDLPSQENSEKRKRKNTIKQVKMKENFLKGYLRRTRKATQKQNYISGTL